MNMRNAEELVSLAIRELGLQTKFERKFADIIEPRIGAKIHVSVDDQASVVFVFLDVTVKAEEGEEKAYVCPAFDGIQAIRHLSSYFTIDFGGKVTSEWVVDSVLQGFSVALENMNVVYIYEDTLKVGA